MKVIRNTKAYEIAVKAATGAIVQDGTTDSGKPKYVKDMTKVKTWFSGKNKKGAQAIKEMAIVMERDFRDENGNFYMPSFVRVLVNLNAGYVELATTSKGIEETVIVKPEEE